MDKATLDKRIIEVTSNVARQDAARAATESEYNQFAAMNKNGSHTEILNSLRVKLQRQTKAVQSSRQYLAELEKIRKALK